MDLRHLLPLALLATVGCNSFNKGACESLALEICDQCDLDDATEDLQCACLEEGEVNNADDYFEDEDDAEIYCAAVKNQVKGTYLTNEDISECRADLDLLKEFSDDACDFLGFGGGGYYEYEYEYEYDSGYYRR